MFCLFTILMARESLNHLLQPFPKTFYIYNGVHFYSNHLTFHLSLLEHRINVAECSFTFVEKSLLEMNIFFLHRLCSDSFTN